MRGSKKNTKIIRIDKEYNISFVQIFNNLVPSKVTMTLEGTRLCTSIVNAQVLQKYCN